MTSCAILSSGGCQSAPRNVRAVESYYQYEFTDARQALRGAALTMNDEQVILNNARLGLAALADGDLREAELGLGKSFELLSTAGLNKDRTIRRRAGSRRGENLEGRTVRAGVDVSLDGCSLCGSR